MNERRARYILPFVILTAILAVSTGSIIIKFAQQDAPSLVIAALRLSFATLLLAPVALTRYRAELRAITRWEIILGLLSGLFLAIHFATWITSLEYTSVASSVIFVSTGPLWVALLSPILLKEHLVRTALFGLTMAILGVSIIGLSGACVWAHGLSCPNLSNVMQGRAMWGNFLALAGAWAVTGYLIIGRKLRGNMSLLPYIFLVYSMAALVLIIIMRAGGESPLGYAPKAYLWIFLLAVVPQLIGHSTYNWLLKYLPATFVAITTLAEPIGAAILAYFLLKETPTPSILIGGGLILVGIYLASKEKDGRVQESA